MGKLEANKQQKLTSLLNTAFNLFTTQGVTKTSIAEISQKAGIAKGTFYLYFKDKYDIRNRLISHESSKLFKNAVADLEEFSKEKNEQLGFEEKIIFIIMSHAGTRLPIRCFCNTCHIISVFFKESISSIN